MLSQDLNTQSFANFAAEVFTDTGTPLLEQQAGIASTYLNKTGYLSGRLSEKPFKVTETDGGATMIIEYPDYIRFLDLKKAASGRAKKTYYPIYNKPLYGFIYGYAYARLRAGLSSNIRNALSVKDKLTVDVSV